MCVPAEEPDALANWNTRLPLVAAVESALNQMVSNVPVVAAPISTVMISPAPSVDDVPEPSRFTAVAVSAEVDSSTPAS